MSELTLIPQVSIHPDKICFFHEVHWDPAKSFSVDPETGERIKKPKFEHLLGSDRTANGKVSDIARRKISKALDYLLLLSSDKKVHSRTTGRHFQFKIAFITLTLPSKQIHPDNEIKSKCLNSFLLELKKFYQVKNYIWRAEKQDNGNLHFHIVVDKFIPWHELRDRWNRIVNKLGYVNRYREELKAWHKNGFEVRKDLLKRWDYKSQVRAYETGKANDWNSPNSTDIHSIKKIIDIKSYISKYMAKNQAVDKETGEVLPEPAKQEGRIWSCNHEISNPTGARLIVDTETEDQLRAVIRDSQCRKYDGDYFSVFFIDFRNLPKFGGDGLFRAFTQYLSETFDYHYQTELAV